MPWAGPAPLRVPWTLALSGDYEGGRRAERHATNGRAGLDGGGRAGRRCGSRRLAMRGGAAVAPACEAGECNLADGRALPPLTETRTWLVCCWRARGGSVEEDRCNRRLSVPHGA